MSTQIATRTEYVLGTDAVELERLSFQHRLWSDSAAAHWERAGFGRGKTIMDVGCGPGFATIDLAQSLGPRGKVLAVDESPAFLDYLNRAPRPPSSAPIETVQADVQRLSLSLASVDGAYARWVLSFTPDPEAVIVGVARALRPGAAFAVQDYCNWPALFWAPFSDTLEVIRGAILKAYADRQANPRVAMHVPALLEKHGLRVREIAPLQRVARPGDALWDWPATYLRSFLPRLIKLGLLTAADFQAWEQEWEVLERTPGAYFFTPPQLCITAEKRAK